MKSEDVTRIRFPVMEWTVLLTFICCTTCGGEDSQSSPQPKSDLNGQWILQSDYSDEFKGTTPDMKKWDNDVADWGAWSWEPDNAWVKDGQLHLQMQYSAHKLNGKKLFYTSGIIKSRATHIKYGYFETRIKAAQRFPGVCPAFWAYRTDEKMWTEIDFAELTETSNNVKRIDTNLHVFQHPKLFKGERSDNNDHYTERRHWDAPWDPRDDFHVYGCEWNEKQIKWYIDGKLINEAKNKYWHQQLAIVLSFGVRSPLNKTPSDQGFPALFQIDYVRVWKNATPLPQGHSDRENRK